MRIFKWSILSCVMSLIAVIIGTFAILWAAKYTTVPLVFLISGAVAYISIYISGTELISRRKKNINLKSYRIIQYSVGGFVMIILALILLLPLPGERNNLVTVEGQQY